MTVKDAAAEGQSQFDLLLSEITSLDAGNDGIAKALKDGDGDADADDKKIEAAAADGDPDADKDADKDKDADADADADADVTKSFKITLDDGTELEAVDGATLIKSMADRIEKNETTSLAAIRGLTDVVKSLQGQVLALASAGRGRKAVISIAEKTAAATPVAKSADTGVSEDEFFAKALALQAAGKNGVTGLDITKAEHCVNNGKPIPSDIIIKVLGTNQ